jgi:polysaccharide pyruvyl transferase WcaK-like protein
MHRRTFVRAALAAGCAVGSAAAADRRAPRVLLRSGWQVVNIGDVGHTPGALALLEQHVPAAEVVVWASASMTPGVVAMLKRRFPKVSVVKGKIGADGKASDKALGEAVARADFLLLGSGATLNARADIEAFVKHTGKPFGVYGITHGGRYTQPPDKGVLDQARFAFFRDSVSLELARKQGVKAPVVEFGPDAAFAVDVRDDKLAAAYMTKHGLEAGKFLAFIPKLRYTPYWKIHGRTEPQTEQEKTFWKRTQETMEPDHAKLRAALVAFVRKTGMKVLLCPEDSSHMEVNKTLVYEKLPEDVQAKAVVRDTFWDMDEAVAVYAKAFAVFSYDMHSPIMALNQGTPAVVVRTAEQSSKGFMWKDIGLGDWLFDLDAEADGANMAKVLLDMAADPAAARGKVEKAMAVVRQRQKETMAVVAKELAR